MSHPRTLLTESLSQPMNDKINSGESHDRKREVERHTLFQPATAKNLEQLLLHIVHGEQTEAEKIIKSNRKLLLETGRVKDYSGRTIEGTALQMALGAEEILKWQK